MKSTREIVGALARGIVRLVILLGIVYEFLFPLQPQPQPPLPPTPQTLLQPAEPGKRFTDADVQTVAVVATYEAQVFPEPLRSRAYRAIAWTMRNRVEIGFGGTVSYSDDRVLSRYASYQNHKGDLPDPNAVISAYEVLNASSSADDPTHGSRNYVDNSYWTGTHEQTGNAVKVRGKLADGDIQRLVDDGKFALTIEWKSLPDHAKGPLFYGLYFFDFWPPPLPIVTPTFTPTPKPTNTRTPTATRTPTLTRTPILKATPTITQTATVMATLPVTPTQTPAPQ